MPYPALDLAGVRTFPLQRRASRVGPGDMVCPGDPLPPLDAPELAQVAAAIVAARRAGRPVICMFGGHVVKRGLAPILIDLMERGVITHLASNGAAVIHDFEIALLGHTSEDVASSLADGSFGMAEETGAWINGAVQAGVRDGLGMGEAVGRLIATANDQTFAYRRHSLVYNAYRLGIPYTVHVAIGTDIIHQHPACDFANLGWASGQDFKVFAHAVSRLEGGVFCNFGSAVIGPEVFLKAVSIVRNLGYTLRDFTTANFDLLSLGPDYRTPSADDQTDYYYRPKKNVVIRPVLQGGRGYHITGDHRATIPHLRARVCEALEADERFDHEERLGHGERLEHEQREGSGAHEARRTRRPPGCAALSSRSSRSPALRAGASVASFAPLRVVRVPNPDPSSPGAPVSIWDVLARPRLAELLDCISRVSIGVIGDFTLDSYWYADMARAELSRETPLFNRPVVRETYSCGGAANVAWNAADLGPRRVEALAVIGQDWRGELLRAALLQAGVGVEHLLAVPDRITPLFGKVILSAHDCQQEDARLDFTNPEPLAADGERAMLAHIEAALPGLDALVVADYHAAGIVTPRLRAALNDLARRFPAKVFVADSREHCGDFPWLSIKPNAHEARQGLLAGGPAASAPLPSAETGRPFGVARPPGPESATPRRELRDRRAGLKEPDTEKVSCICTSELAAAVAACQAQSGRPAFLTLGGEGCLVFGGQGCLHVSAAPVPPPIDTVGAGDTFVATAAAALAAGAHAAEAGALAQLAAAVIIRKLRITGTATPAEIMAAYDALGPGKEQA